MNKLSRIINILLNWRRTGCTTTLAGVAKIHPKAIIVVGNYWMKEDLVIEHKIPNHQVVSAISFEKEMMGKENGPLLFDLTGIIQLLCDIENEHQKEVDRLERTILKLTGEK